MRVTKIAMASLVLAALLLSPSGQAIAAPAPAWKLSLIPMPTVFRPGTTGSTGQPSFPPRFRLLATNVGGAPTGGPVTMAVDLPPGVAPAPSPPVGDLEALGAKCSVSGQEIGCEASGRVYPGRSLGLSIPVEVNGGPGPLAPAQASVEGGGSVSAVTVVPTEIGPEPPPFGFVSGPAGLGALLTNSDGSPAIQAGSHPSRFTASLAFPTEQPTPETGALAAGHLRDVATELPRGMVVNPQATATRCTQAQLLASPDEARGVEGCPASSQVGTLEVLSEIAAEAKIGHNGLYNMVPPPGVPAELGAEAISGIFIYIEGGVRSDGDYGLSATTSNVLARTVNPIFSLQAQLWGDPASSIHDHVRGPCQQAEGSCPVPPAERTGEPFLTLPSQCSGPLPFSFGIDSWEEPRDRQDFIAGVAPSTDLEGNPVGVSGCAALEFKPTLSVRPDSSAAESPTGLHVDLHVPQHEKLSELLATSNLEDATVTLPAGVAVNPASAGGLGACSEEQIGYQPKEGQIHFSKQPDICPDAAKVGSVEVDTPLLDHPLPGSVYVATPLENPFGSLLAIYIAIDDPADGIFAKLAGEVHADPNSGQLTTTFRENPELPVEDFKLDFFGGPRAALRTPSTCGRFTTEGEFSPWSGNPPVLTTDSFQVAAGPNGASCTSNEAQKPNAPSFEAGTLVPLAGSYSPFVMRLQREDGSQLLKGLDLTLPPGLTGRLAGLATCSDAQIATAAAKTGREEQANPSCPAASEVGQVTVGAGAGSQPYYTQGKIYLAGPYKGAPLSFAIVTPAVAGPYDLGDVVTRAAAHVDPITAAITVKSDPLPTILQGIPLQLRDVRVNLGRPDFTLNPTSCERMSVGGTATSPLGSAASLSSRFQAAGCSGLSFAPKLSLRLKGPVKRSGNPALTAVLTQRPGQANIAAVQVALPHSEFLDQAHIRTVCTRVQFAANLCPAGAVYGEAEATTPLLDEKLSGPVYLRSSSHQLPDLVAVLRGPASRPLEVVLDGRVDSVHGGIRNSFEVVPDQPVSRFVLRMQGGKKGLLENSRNLCKSVNKASVKFTGQNGKVSESRPTLEAKCKGRKKQGRHHKRRALG